MENNKKFQDFKNMVADLQRYCDWLDNQQPQDLPYFLKDDLTQPSDPLVNKCSVCGIEFSSTMGYVCNSTSCPMRVSSVTFPLGLNTGG